MRDFTHHSFKQILVAFKEHGCVFQTFADFLHSPSQRTVILRHDVDARKENALMVARMEAEMGISGTYYFRMVPGSFDADVIRQISGLGHEIGYHYEDLAMAARELKKTGRKMRNTGESDRLLYEKAISLFEKHLQQFRDIVSVNTICMHGSPLSRYDNRKIWDHYSYRDYGIAGEPYFDVDYNDVLYLSDTGRRWNGEKMSLRDRVGNGFEHSIRTSSDLINAIPGLPERIMINFHPQRWDNRPWPWIRELVLQNLKNVVKRLYVRTLNE
ncbi:MAG: hypothetical protein JXA61_08805 [Bacteroidales bacterium]|nr:hypothetical protein [Bacteroidales bacterium]